MGYVTVRRYTCDRCGCVSEGDVGNWGRVSLANLEFVSDIDAEVCPACRREIEVALLGLGLQRVGYAVIDWGSAASGNSVE